MKKLSVVFALIAFGGLAASTFADVQNIRISGDIRIRGYYLNDVVCNTTGTKPADTSFISQRTRVTVEADLEDHILAVVTIRAEGLWGANDESAGSSGAGWSTTRINRGWDVGIDEAYVQFNEVFWSAATLKLGRQYLNYGRGLILSSNEQEYNFDAARLVLDFYPLVIDVVGAKLVEGSTFTSVNSGHGGSDLLFVNARYEMANSPIKDVEAYIGYVSQPGSANIASTRVPPTDVVGTSPVIAGLRADLAPVKNWDIWAEGAYEFGTDSLSAWLVNLGTQFTMKDVRWTPSLNANYTYASGGGKGGTFIPWFNYGYNGYLFNPAYANIHIFNLGASVKPAKNTSLALEGYYYLKASRNVNVASGANTDFGGFGFVGSATSQNVGFEVDAIAGYDYSKDVRVQLVYGVFVPDNAFSGVTASTAQEIRGEIDVKF